MKDPQNVIHKDEAINIHPWKDLRFAFTSIKIVKYDYYAQSIVS